MSRMSNRVRIADRVYLIIQLFSKTCFLFLGIFGYVYFKFLGLGVGILIGFLFSKWVSYSLGIYRKEEYGGFYKRKEERANGSRSRLLEFVMEKLRDSEFTVEKCQKLHEVYLEFKDKASKAKNEKELMDYRIELDYKTKKISYES